MFVSFSFNFQIYEQKTAQLWSEDCEFTSVRRSFCILTSSVTIFCGICGIMGCYSTGIIFVVWPRCSCKFQFLVPTQFLSSLQFLYQNCKTERQTLESIVYNAYYIRFSVFSFIMSFNDSNWRTETNPGSWFQKQRQKLHCFLVVGLPLLISSYPSKFFACIAPSYLP